MALTKKKIKLIRILVSSKNNGCYFFSLNLNMGTAVRIKISKCVKKAQEAHRKIAH